jgi:hypothetical protein
MKKTTWKEAWQAAHDLVQVDHEKVIKLLTLRAAQIKYVLNRSPLFEDEALVFVRKKIDPPVSSSGDALIQYGLSMHETFVQHIRPQLEQSAHARENEKWRVELEETLLEMRRIVMRNLSKHPALRPYNLLTVLKEKVVENDNRNNSYAQLLQRKAIVTREIMACDRDAAECRAQPGFDTLRRLDESLEKLVAEKRALNEHWLAVWQSLGEIFKRLAENDEASKEWENSQHRMLHLYLTNPALTRDRDAHGQGLVMILRLAVSALESRKKLFSGMTNEEVNTILLNALENPLFVNFREHMHALDAAISGNQNERSIHPHYRILAEIQHRINGLQREHEKIDEEIFLISQEKDSLSNEIQSIWNDANHACQTQLNVELEKIVH